MVSPWTLYWMMRMDALSSLFIGVSVSGVIVLGSLFVIRTVVYTDSEEKTAKEFLRLSKTPYRLGIAVVLVFFPLAVLTPTTKQMAVIYVLPKVVNNEKVQEECGEVYGLAKDWLKSQVGDEKENK